jgi:hypothetical protein
MFAPTGQLRDAVLPNRDEGAAMMLTDVRIGHNVSQGIELLVYDREANVTERLEKVLFR